MSAAILLSLAMLSAPPEDFDAFFERFAEKRAGIRVLEADLVEETIQYGDVIARSGHLVFGQPRRIIFRYGDDDARIMIDDRWYYELDPAAEQLQIHSIDSRPEASMFFLGFDSDARALREAFDVQLFSIKSDRGSRGLSIRPRADAETASFQEVSLYLRDEDYLPYRIEITLDEDTRTVTEFSNYKINHDIDPSLTQLQIPAGTRVLEDGEVIIREVPEGGIKMPADPLDPDAAPETEPEAASPAVDASPHALEVQELPAP